VCCQRCHLILELSCDVQSTGLLDSQYVFAFDSKTLILVPSADDKGNSVVTRIVIRKRIPESAAFKATSRPPGSDGTEGEFRLEGTGDTETELVDDLQLLESLLSLCGVKKINWQSPKLNFIPENDEERNNLSIYSWKRWKEYPRTYVKVRTDWLDERVRRFQDLKVPLAFFREGMTAYEQFNYVISFQNFYFILEGFYAEGEWKSEEDRFLENKELMDYLRSAFPQILQIQTKLGPVLSFYNLDMTPESFVKLVVKVRHRVHHYFHEKKGQEYFANPFVQEYYQPVALALMLLCVHVLFGRIAMTSS
jgi:hypothetical protein